MLKHSLYVYAYYGIRRVKKATGSRVDLNKVPKNVNRIFVYFQSQSKWIVYTLPMRVYLAPCIIKRMLH